jgi:hypothetical protein
MTWHPEHDGPMVGESTHQQDRRFVAGVAFSPTVQEAIDRVLTRPDRTRPLQTGELLAELAEADADPDWVRVWPSYEGGADAQLAAASDTRHQPSGHSWRGVPLSQDLLAALRLLTVMATRYEMDPVQLGAVVLALAADPGTGSAQYLGRLSGCDHAELLDRIQSDLVGVILEGFDELTGHQQGSPEAAAGRGRTPRWQVLARCTAALCFLWVAWLALRAGTGGAIAVGIAVVAVITSLMAALVSFLSGPSAGWDPRNWQIKWRPQYTRGWFILGLGIIVLLGIVSLNTRHRHPGLATPNLILLGGGLTILLVRGSFSVGSRRPGAPPRAGSPSPGNLQYGALFEAPLVLAAGIGLLAWYARLSLISLGLPGSDMPWRARVIAWNRQAFTGAHLGRFFGNSYWPLLIVAVAFVGCYFCALAVQLAVTRVNRRFTVFAACSAAVGVLIVAVSYAGLLP